MRSESQGTNQPTPDDPKHNIKKRYIVKTFTPKPADLTHDWYIIDATDVVLGRLSVAAANLLRGKN